MLEPLFRRATAGDAQAIDAIYNHYVRTSTATLDLDESTIASRLRWIEDHGDAYPAIVVLGDSGEVIGWGSISPFKPRAGYAGSIEITAYVAPDMLGRRLGEALFVELERLAVELGYHVVVSIVTAENTASVDLALRLGYREVGRLREIGRKFGRLLDVVFLEKILGTSEDEGGGERL